MNEVSKLIEAEPVNRESPILAMALSGNSRIPHMVATALLCAASGACAPAAAMELGNCRIRKIDAAGTMTTVAGSECGTFGAPVRDGGPATSARLLRPFKAIEGPDGTIYIADTDNHRIRRVLGDGTIETVAGTGGLGCAGLGGPARSAEITNPRDLAFDAEGNLLIVNWYVDGAGSSACTGVYRLDREGLLTRLVDQSHRQCEGAGCVGRSSMASPG